MTLDGFDTETLTLTNMGSILNNAEVIFYVQWAGN